MKATLLVLMFVHSLAFADATAPAPTPDAAPSCGTLTSLWNNVYTKRFQIDWATKKLDCPGGESSLAEALYDLQNFKFPSTLKVPPNFYNTVALRVREFAYDTTCEYLAQTSDHTITLCKPFFDDERADRASTLVHESRHTDADDPGHVTCSKGQYEGNENACDEDFFDGAWAGSGFNGDAYFYGNAMNKALPNAITRAELQSNLDDILPERFNHITAKQVKAWRP